MPMVSSELSTPKERGGLLFDMPKILITGSTGLVGSEAVKFFREKGWYVVGIDNNMRAKNLGTPDKVPEIELDIRNWHGIVDLFSKNSFDAVIHAAAQASHDWSKKEPVTDFGVNALGTLLLLEATRLYCPKAVFVYVSSDKVYGENIGNDKTLWTENVSLDRTSRTPFGVSKLAADLYVQEYGRWLGIKTACFRCGCITGKAHEGAELHGFLAYLTKCIKEGKTYKIFGFKGEQVRDQIHAYDLVNAFWHFIQKSKIAEVYNMGGGPERSKTLNEFAEMISKEVGKPFVSEYEEVRWADRGYDVHDVSKFRKDYPEWDYKYSLEDIIKDLCGS